MFPNETEASPSPYQLGTSPKEVAGPSPSTCPRYSVLTIGISIIRPAYLVSKHANSSCDAGLRELFLFPG